MKLAVLSDTRLPTAASFPGHGMGKVNLLLAEGLRARGHEVTLFAGVGSEFSGALVVERDEADFLKHGFSAYDAILDGGHFHALGKARPDLPVVNLSQDREAKPGACAVFSSKAHRAHHGYTDANGRVIYNGVNLDAFPFNATPGNYVAYLSMFHAPKGPVMAWNVARLAGVRLVMAGPTPPAPPPGAEYIGPVSGADKAAFLGHARALLFPASTEAGPITPLEAQACGTPVLVVPTGAAHENMADGVTGFVCQDTLDMVDKLARVDELDRAAVRAWVEANRSEALTVEQYEAALQEVARGKRW